MASPVAFLLPLARVAPAPCGGGARLRSPGPLDRFGACSAQRRARPGAGGNSAGRGRRRDASGRGQGRRACRRRRRGRCCEGRAAPRGRAVRGAPCRGFPTAVVSVPIGATARRPVLIASHGNYDRPEWQCQVWRDIVGDGVFVLCPRGVARPDSPSASDVRFTYESNARLEQEIDAGLAALRARFPEHVDPGAVLYTGFSLGAIMGSAIAARRAALFPRLVLVEGGHDKWTPATAKAFADGGGQRVLFVCAQAGCGAAAAAAAARLDKAGVLARVARSKEAGHRYDGPVAEETRRGAGLAGRRRPALVSAARRMGSACDELPCLLGGWDVAPRGRPGRRAASELDEARCSSWLALSRMRARAAAVVGCGARRRSLRRRSWRPAARARSRRGARPPRSLRPWSRRSPTRALWSRWTAARGRRGRARGAQGGAAARARRQARKHRDAHVRVRRARARRAQARLPAGRRDRRARRGAVGRRGVRGRVVRHPSPRLRVRRQGRLARPGPRDRRRNAGRPAPGRAVSVPLRRVAEAAAAPLCPPAKRGRAAARRGALARSGHPCVVPPRRGAPGEPEPLTPFFASRRDLPSRSALQRRCASPRTAGERGPTRPSA